jgi:hypothetical protein
VPRRERTEYLRAYREAHREKAKATTRAWRAADAEREKASKRASYLRHRGRRLEAMRAYGAANAPKLTEYRKAWLRANPETARLYAAKILLSAATGLRFSQIPQPLAEAKASWLAVIREVRASGMEARQGGDGTAPSRSDDSPTAEGGDAHTEGGR